MERNVTVQVPVFNETAALRFSKFYFDSIGQQVRYVIDCQAPPETRKVVQELGIDEIFFENDKPFIENGYEAFAAASPTDWIFRIDCDELPTREALRFARCAKLQDQEIASFDRYQVLWNGQSFIYPVHDRFTPYNQRQFRLFNRCHVRFDRKIHTPGIEVQRAVHAPPDAALVHLSWVFLSWEQRVAKADRYDAHGQPEANRDNQLFSLHHDKWIPANLNEVSLVYRDWIR